MIKLAKPKEIAEIVKLERAKLGLSQTGLAKISRLSPTTICFIERGDREFRLATLIKVAKALNINYKLFVKK